MRAPGLSSTAWYAECEHCHIHQHLGMEQKVRGELHCSLHTYTLSKETQTGPILCISGSHQHRRQRKHCGVQTPNTQREPGQSYCTGSIFSLFALQRKHKQPSSAPTHTHRAVFQDLCFPRSPYDEAMRRGMLLALGWQLWAAGGAGAVHGSHCAHWDLQCWLETP